MCNCIRIRFIYHFENGSLHSSLLLHAFFFVRFEKILLNPNTYFLFFKSTDSTMMFHVRWIRYNKNRTRELSGAAESLFLLFELRPPSVDVRDSLNAPFGLYVVGIELPMFQFDNFVAGLICCCFFVILSPSLFSPNCWSRIQIENLS